MSTSPIRVVIADDHPVVREGLRLILEAGDGFEVVGEAVDGEQAVALATERAPDVLLLDLRMPRLDGLAALRRLRTAGSTVAVVVLTTFHEDELAAGALRAGARGYLLKDATREQLLDAVRATARGGTLLQPEVLARLLGGPAPAEDAGLSQRESEVLVRVAAGDRNKEIATRLGISERTVKAHLVSVFNKLGVDSRAAAVAEAMRRGLISGGRES